MGKVIIATSEGQFSGSDIDSGALVDNRYFKILSLLLADSAGVNIPHTLFLLEDNRDAVRHAWKNWKRPFILRVDFSALPARKVLGGIAVADVDSLFTLCDWLRARSYRPAMHPFLDRFRNIYSVGILITLESATVSIEVVGPGFDAGDLRLGIALPHESFDLDTRSGAIENERCITQDCYQGERRRRLEEIARLWAYTEYAEQHGCLLTNLQRFQVGNAALSEAALLVPEVHEPMPREIRGPLRGVCKLLRSEVVPYLPRSSSFVASLSHFAAEGWLLWDVYGQWYAR